MEEKFAEALMAALRNIRVLGADDTCAVLDLYMGTNAARKVPPLIANDRGDAATGSPQ